MDPIWTSNTVAHPGPECLRAWIRSLDVPISLEGRRMRTPDESIRNERCRRDFAKHAWALVPGIAHVFGACRHRTRSQHQIVLKLRLR